MSNKILVLGDGLLGSEIISQTKWKYISRKKDNFNLYDSLNRYFNGYDTLVNCIGHTNTRDNSKLEHWAVNVFFVRRLIDYCNTTNKKLVHISTDYLYSGSPHPSKETDILVPPKTWYCQSKLVSDYMIQEFCNSFLIIRTSYKKRPYQYPYAWIDLIGNFDYVDVIAPMIIKLIKIGTTGVYNVGTEPKTLFELARQTNPSVEADYEPSEVDRPNIVIMDTTKYTRELTNYEI